MAGARGTTDGAPAIALRGVRKIFPVGAGTDLDVLDIAELSVPAGGWTALRGRSGSGKTTLLNLIAGLARPTAGSITVDGADLVAMSEAHRDAYRTRRIGYVFQTFNLLSAFSALENVMLAMMFADAVPSSEHRRRATTMLTRLGLGARLAHRPDQLSRGEQQRVAIARALVNDPPIVLADEPCANLDARTAEAVLTELLAMCRTAGQTMLVATHDATVLAAVDRVIDMAEVNRCEARAGVGGA